MSDGLVYELHANIIVLFAIEGNYFIIFKPPVMPTKRSIQ
jgi:hypothetical protein